MCARMLVSIARNRYREIDGAKVSRGQFQTSGGSWLAPQVAEFIRAAAPRVLYDPFAGAGRLLRTAQAAAPEAVLAGLDIDPAAGWPRNDSLESIPPLAGAVIVTNPPYLAKHSARRKGVLDTVAARYASRPDLYQLALDRCQEACARTVAIVPETVINSRYPKHSFASITILEENPFSDTECPVCVVCIAGNTAGHPGNGPLVYRGAQLIGSLVEIEKLRLKPAGTARLVFNAPEGRIALRAVDLPAPAKSIRFLPRAELDYDPARIKVSSRLMTFIDAPDVPEAALPGIISRANALLAAYRQATGDILLSPFKGNTAAGTRRRRLDYRTARAILETAITGRDA